MQISKYIQPLSFRVPYTISLIAAGLALAGCGSAVSKEKPQPVAGSEVTEMPGPLGASMQNMKISLERLLPYLVDREAFEAPQNESRLKHDISQLDKISKAVSHADFKAQTDPSYGFLSEGFHDELGRSLDAFETGKKDYARYSLLNVTAYCIECHTRTASGPAFNSPDLSSTLKRLKPLERGEYLLSVRQFDGALEEFKNILKTEPDEKFNFYDYDRALRYAMAITVKFQNDPVKTEQVIQQISASAKIPYFLKQAASAWNASIDAWKREKASKKTSVKDRLDMIDLLVKRGRVAQQGVSDRSGDVEFLRALSEAHLLLMTKLTPDQMGRVLFRTGQAYESVRDLALWNLHENYYEACVRRVPHSKWSRQCYKSLQESVFIGYTGTSGTRIPPDVQARLSKLEKLAN